MGVTHVYQEADPMSILRPTKQSQMSTSIFRGSACSERQPD